MSVRCLSRICLSLAVLIWGGLGAGVVRAEDKTSAQDPSRAQADARPAPESAAPAHATAKKDGLKELEEELNQALKSFATSNPRRGVTGRLPPMPVRPIISSQSARELLDRQKNWVFMTPEELILGSKTQEFLKSPEERDAEDKDKDKDSKKLTAMERFYLNLKHESADGFSSKTLGRDSSWNGTSSGRLKSSDSSDDDQLPSEVRNSESRLRKALGSDFSGGALSSSSIRGTFSDVFGLGQNQDLSPDQIRAHEDYLKRYQELLNGSANSQVTSPFNDVSKLGASPASGINTTLSDFSSKRGAGFDPQSGAASPYYIPGTPQDVNDRVLNQWNPLHSTASVKTDTTKAAPPSFTSIEFPRRKF